jgi:plastocyanin
MRTAWLGVTVALVAVLAAGCGGKTAQQPQPTQSPAGQPSPGAQPARPAGKITIIGKDNLYEPATVEIKAGQETEILFKNVGTSVHNLIVQSRDAAGQDFQTDVVVNTNQDSTFKVKIDKPGTYVMQCTYHPEMKGELKVTR